MHLRKLSLINFKNYDQIELEFAPRINCFTGLNGVGKTNLLDAIYYLSLCKSYFNPVDSQNIKHGCDFFVIEGEYERNDETEHIYCGLKRSQKKQFKRNRKEYGRLSDHIGFIPLVMISPADSSLITEGSEERRHFMNAVIAQYDHQYLELLIRYNNALTQRNKLLKDFAFTGKFDRESLELWNEQLVIPGEKIGEIRKNFVQELVPVFQQYYAFISGDNEKVGLHYQSHLLEGDFREALRLSIEKDRILQFTTTGVHKDDLLLKLGEHSIKRTGSQGQQKTYMVALKIAQFDFISKHNGQRPILLLDDIFDKFDSTRVKKIIELFAENHFGQIFITDTHHDRMQQVISALDIEFRMFTISGNQISL
jgi:DNA replication and repair protein RecF